MQFPDPWDNRRHEKRRLLSPAFAQACAKVLPSGGQLYVSSDAEELAMAMRHTVKASGHFKLTSPESFAAAFDFDSSPEAQTVPTRQVQMQGEINDAGWVSLNPFGVPTERDQVCETMWRDTWRVLWTRL